MQEIDPAILQACLKQDSRAEYALYTACFQPLMSICYRYTRNEDDAADLLNKGFLKILSGLSKYDSSLPFQKWIKRIMINTIIDEFRKNKTYKTLMHHVDLSTMENHASLNLNEAEIRLSAEDIHRCINKLPDSSKMVLNMFVFEDMSHKEIAKVLSISEGTSKWHLSNARNLLRQILNKSMSSIKLYIL